MATINTLTPAWNLPSNVGAAVTTRRGAGQSSPPFGQFNLGLHSGEASEVVMANRAALQQQLDLPAPPCWLRQVHGIHVVRADHAIWQQTPEADASMATRAGSVLAILTADCLPVLLCHKNGQCIGAAHAGWRGLAGGVIEACLEAMAVPPQDVTAWLGPCIGPSSYEVDGPVYTALDGKHAPEGAFIPTRAGHWQANLALLAKYILHRAGVASVSGGSFDTFTDSRFYSYRREGAESGRFASLVWLKKDPEA